MFERSFPSQNSHNSSGNTKLNIKFLAPLLANILRLIMRSRSLARLTTRLTARGECVYLEFWESNHTMSDSPSSTDTPSNASLEKALKHAVQLVYKNGNLEELTVKRIRSFVEKVSSSFGDRLRTIDHQTYSD